MKYYKINIKRIYENDMIVTNANGSKIPNGSEYFWKMENGGNSIGYKMSKVITAIDVVRLLVDNSYTLESQNSEN